MATRDEVLSAARAAFAESDLAAILTVLDRYGAESWEREKERVQLACIELSTGNRERLLHYVEAAKTDYRDVLSWQQLGPFTAEDGRNLQEAARTVIDRWGKTRS